MCPEIFACVLLAHFVLWVDFAENVIQYFQQNTQVLLFSSALHCNNTPLPLQENQEATVALLKSAIKVTTTNLSFVSSWLLSLFCPCHIAWTEFCMIRNVDNIRISRRGWTSIYRSSVMRPSFNLHCKGCKQEESARLFRAFDLGEVCYST